DLTALINQCARPVEEGMKVTVEEHIRLDDVHHLPELPTTLTCVAPRSHVPTIGCIERNTKRRIVGDHHVCVPASDSFLNFNVGDLLLTPPIVSLGAKATVDGICATHR